MFAKTLKVMTELEQHIYDYVMDKIPSMVEDLKKSEFKTELVKYPIMIDGSIDSVVFDAKTLKPLRIDYNYGIGPGVSDGIVNYFDDFEVRCIYL
jgi:hypothetical protein